MTAHGTCKQIGPRLGPTNCWDWSGFNLFDTRTVFLIFWSTDWLVVAKPQLAVVISSDVKKHEKYTGGKELTRKSAEKQKRYRITEKAMG